MSAMFVLCSTHPKLTSLGLGWRDALTLDVKQRDALLRLLEETRDEEVKAYRRR